MARRARTKKSAEPENRRGSPEAIAKRRAARAFNNLLDPQVAKHDGRTEKRRQRLLAELESGTTRAGRPLKPVDILTHANELLSLGEDVATLKRLRKGQPAFEESPRLLDVLGELHRAYAFNVDAYVVVGLSQDALRRAGILPARRRGKRSTERPGTGR